MLNFKNLPKYLSIPLLIVFIVGLYWSLNKVFVPFVLKITASDLFFEPETEQEELGKISTERTNHAFEQCKAVMKSENHVPEGSTFSESSYEAWALGGKVYLIRSQVNVPADSGRADKKYACKIKFAGGNLTDAANWSILGVDFNSDFN